MPIIIAYDGTEILVDEDDFEFLNKYKWSITQKGHRRTVYARTNIKSENGRYYTERMHRLVLGVGKGEKVIVDHINGNGLDNRKSNLRKTDFSGNASNVPTHKGNTSGYKGVYYRKARRRWVVEVRKERKTVVRKHFQCKHCAALFYNEKAKEIHGEFAWQNEVEGCGCNGISAS